MSYFLIDYENVKSEGFEGIETLTPDDYVFVLYSDNCKTITFNMMEKINKSQAHIFYQAVSVGTKNALDFQLSSYLGYLIGNKGSDQQYYIVTKDQGYKCLASFWSKESVHVELADNVGRQLSKQVAKVRSNLDSLTLDPQVKEEVERIIVAYKTKQGINNALVKKYGVTKAGELYKQIKPFLKDKKGR